MEKQGIGINLILGSCLDAGLAEPQFIELEHHVKLVMFRKQLGGEVADAAHTSYDSLAIKRHFSAKGLFTSREFAHYIGKSVSMAKKILFDYQQQGLVEMVGKGPATKYRFIPTESAGHML